MKERRRKRRAKWHIIDCQYQKKTATLTSTTNNCGNNNNNNNSSSNIERLNQIPTILNWRTFSISKDNKDNHNYKILKLPQSSGMQQQQCKNYIPPPGVV